jgi:hypothetical protein
VLDYPEQSLARVEQLLTQPYHAIVRDLVGRQG